MAFWDDLDFGKVAESVSENAGDWINTAVETYQKEASAQPETNDKRAENVTFGDGKESPTVQTTATGTTQFISGVDNKMVVLGVVGILALVLIKG